MTTESDGPLAAAGIAAAVAPIVDRLRISIAHRAIASDRARELVGNHGLSPEAVGTVAMLRHLVPDRAVPIESVLHVFVYSDESEVRQRLDTLVATGHIDIHDGVVRLTAAGQDLLCGIYGVTEEIVGDLWRSHAPTIAVAGPLVSKVVQAASATGGPGFHVLTPQFTPPDASAAVVLAEHLTALRFHRFDAHVTAWQDAGLSVADVQHLPLGRQRDSIEADTNRRDAPPYETLTLAERFDIVAALGALPN